MTLLELLTVIAIVASLFAISVSVYRKASVTQALPAAASRVSSVIRAARTFSLQSGLPSRVFVEPEKSRISAFGYELVAAWHFEDLAVSESPIPRGTLLAGALNEKAEVIGECYVTKGKIGNAIEFADEGAALVSESRPRLNSPAGFSLEAWVRFYPPPLTDSEKRRASRGKGGWEDPRRDVEYAIISKEGGYEMGLLGDGAVYIRIGDATSDDEYFARTRGGLVSADRWTHVGTTYDGLSLTVLVNGVEYEWIPAGFELISYEDWPPLPLRIPASDGYLTISSPSAMFLGVIDQPKVRLATEPQTYKITGNIRLLHDRAFTIRFDSRGSLDPLYHSSPAWVRLADFADHPDPPEEGVTPGTTAVVESDPESDSADNLGDPLLALAEYLEQHAEASESPNDTDTELEPGDKDREKGRVRSIIVDLTGTIRG